MDIHKPKAVHSWREFLIEIGTIICGILIALALDQAVEAAKLARELSETREAIRAEVAENSLRARFTILENECGSFGAAKTRAWANGGPKPSRPTPLRPALLSLSTSVWEVAQTRGVARMPIQEQLKFERYYDEVRQFNQNQATKRQIGLQNASLMELESLTPEQGHRLAESLISWEILSSYQTSNAKDLLASRAAREVKVPPPSQTAKAQLATWCAAAGAPPPNLSAL